MLILVTKHHGEARLRVADGYIGSGKLEGLGYYLDTTRRMKELDTSIRSVGYLAPYVYVDVNLVDLVTGTLVRRATIATGYTIATSHNAAGVQPWDALSGEEKVATLKNLLTKELQGAMPALIAGAPTGTAP